MRYFLELSYDGSSYCGWQRQPAQPSVQQTLEEAAVKLLPVSEIVGCGRTDTGVHASFYVAHFDTPEPISDAEQFLYQLNRILPPDIAVSAIREVSDEMHARYSAREREYKYFIEPRKNPFTRASTWQYGVPLDVEGMNEAAKILLETDDFTSFAKLNSGNKTNICRVSHARWEVIDNKLIFTIRSDRFLRNMVRAIVGTLVDVGRGRLSVEEFRAIVTSRDLSRSSAGAPPQGLFLSNVKYQ